MAGFRLPEQPREQLELFPRRLDESIPQDHPVRNVLAILESADFRSTLKRMEREYDTRQGRPSYHPRYLLGLYIYGMYIGLRSSRRLEEACHNRIDVRFLMEDQRPDHSTIADFVRLHSRTLHRVLKGTLQIGRRAGLLRLERVAIDGTHLKSRASRKSIKRRSDLESESELLDREIERLERQFDRNEEEERLNPPPVLFSESAASAESSESAMKRRKALIDDALAELRDRKSRASRRHDKVNDSVSLTDPESRGLFGKDGQYGPHYNAQLGTDVESGMIVAASVNDEANDAGQLLPMVEQVIDNCDEHPKKALADSGYSSGPDLTALEEAGIEAYVPDRETSREADEALMDEVRDRLSSGEILEPVEARKLPRGRNGKIHRRSFAYREEEDVYICPLGQELRYRTTQTQQLKGKKVKRRNYRAEDCRGCPLIDDCCGEKNHRRTITRDKHEQARDRSRKRLRNANGKAIYNSRNPSIEGRIGLLTNVFGLRRSTRFGRLGVETEWLLGAIAINFRVLIQNWTKTASILPESG